MLELVHWVRLTIPRRHLFVVCCLAIIGTILVQGTALKQEHPVHTEQLLAAELMQESLKVIKEARLGRDIPIDRELDPNETGLIGREFTEITTSLGNIEAKRTSTNPSFAALLVRLFHQADLKEGATVAIGASGSFPGLIVATLAACRAMGLEPLLFYSVGSSMYGANIAEFSFIEMLEVLRNRDVLPYTIQAVSLGSDNDRGDGMFLPESQAIMMQMAHSAGAPLIFPANNSESIQQRLAMYLEYNKQRVPDIFVNIGGAVPNVGNTNASLKIPSGLVERVPVRTKDPERGLIFEYLERSVPVIHLLNIRDLALKSGIAIDPIPFPPIGSEGVYFVTVRNRWLIWGSMVAVFGVLLFGKRSIGSSK